MKVEKGRIIYDIIEPNKRQYSIPVYQRNYDWSITQCEKLFYDIIAAHKNDKTHFVGSIVNAQIPSQNKINRYVIIDGQQRITTIIILLKALYDCADRETDRLRLTEWMFNEDKYDELHIDDTNKLKLKPIKSDNEQLLSLMNNKHDSLDKSANLYRNYEKFKSLIQDQLKPENALTIRDICDGIEKLICAMITLDESDSPQEVFESINSTGLPLTISDLIRNYVLMTDENQEFLYERYWRPIESIIGKSEMPSFIIDYLNFKLDGFVKEKDAYNKFKNLFESKDYSNQSMLEELLKYAEYYHCFMHGDDKYSEKTNMYLRELRQLKQTTIYVFLFKLFDDFNSNICSLSELEKTLKFFLSYSIRRIVCEINSNSLRGLYKTLHSRIFSKVENKEHYYDSIVSFFDQLNSRDRFPTDDEFALALKQNDLYHKNAVCKYLLGNLENYESKEKLEIKSLTIEHVMPQNENLSDEWKRMLGSDWLNIHIKYLHTLGNLTLTGYNSELSDNFFTDKKKLLADKLSKVVVLNSEIINQEVWDKEAIEARAEILAKRISEMYSVDAPETVISFADKRYKEYTLDNPENATNKTPNYYILQGEKVNVNDFAEMTVSVIKMLYDMDSTVIERIAKNNETILEGSSIVFLTYDKALLKYCNQLGDTGIYYNNNFSAARRMYFLKALLNEYDIDGNEFIYSAKQNAD